MLGHPAMVGAMGRGLLIDWLAVAGGNGAQTGLSNATDAGSGSGGVVLTGQSRARIGSYAITVGIGGADGGATQGAVGFTGTNSIIAGIADTGPANGLGGGYNLTGVQVYGWGGPSANFGGGAPGGGPSWGENIAGKAGGAGGGAGGSATGATPGAGIISSISGAAVEYGRGGVTWDGPGGTVDNPGNPGQGGYGGRGGTLYRCRGTYGAGGIVIIRYVGTTARASGGIVQVLGGYVIHTFNSNGTFTVNH